MPNNAEIILYLGAEKSTELCIVPNVVGDSAAAANRKLTDAGLIMSVSGATGGSSASVRAISQSETPGTEVAAGHGGARPVQRQLGDGLKTAKREQDLTEKGRRAYEARRAF